MNGTGEGDYIKTPHFRCVPSISAVSLRETAACARCQFFTARWCVRSLRLVSRLRSVASCALPPTLWMMTDSVCKQLFLQTTGGTGKFVRLASRLRSAASCALDAAAHAAAQARHAVSPDEKLIKAEPLVSSHSADAAR